MVTVMRTGKSIRRSFMYNENKVEKGVARCLFAENYPLNTDQLSQSDRLNLLLQIAAKRESVTHNSVHISINFAPGEQFTTEKLCAIARDYMEEIGLGSQPYLVYQHHDAGHPHLHVVTTKISPKGENINLHNLGKTLSEPVRKKLEEKYNLVRAEDHKRQSFQLKPIDVIKVAYGKNETRQAIAKVLEHVLNRYSYTSLNELNAVLNLYNVHADHGAEGSRINQNQGLVYRILDADRKPIGVPLKASLFYNRPTLKYLAPLFLRGKEKRKPHAERLQTAIALALKNSKVNTLDDFTKNLKRSAIQVVPRINANGRLYGITYVDHFGKCVFNGSDLGKEYSANAIFNRLSGSSIPLSSQKIEPAFLPPVSYRPSSGSSQEQGTLDILFQYENTPEYLPPELRGKRKRKKKQH
uniref:relaxase/mobilization nuclease domain-containing protein n=1 Tax=Pedobacter schmidteae TaxID=2201271 RepID=UPI000EADC7CC|nr:relaxase/mobilization nuclease domain-containing protein [Pedobacter schmidteae]